MLEILVPFFPPCTVVVFSSKHDQVDYKKHVFKVRTIVNSVVYTIKLISILGATNLHSDIHFNDDDCLSSHRLRQC